MGMFFLNLKLEISFFDLVATAFCPVTVVSSSIAISINFLSATAPLTPLFKQILVILGTCITEL